MARKRGFFAELQHQQMVRERERQRQWQQAQREAERAVRARERALAKEAREQRELHVKQQQNEAVAMTTAAQERVDELGRVLVDGLRHRSVFSFAQMRRSFKAQRFEAPPALATPATQPQWERYAPPPPSGVRRLFKGAQNKAVDQAKARFAHAMARYEQVEHERLAALAAAEARHRQAEESRRQEVEQHNAQVADLESRVLARAPEAVEDYFELLIEQSPLPADLPVDVEVAYQSDSKKLLMIGELPGVDVIPPNREYTYVKSRDEIVAKPRLAKEVKQAYANLVAQIVLRMMRDVFEVRPSDLVDEVAVNAHVSTRNRATGKPERPCLVSVSATRKQFEELVLTELDPAECLKYFNALVSPHPWDLEAVRPIFDPDLSKYRLVDAHDVAAGLDGRAVLLEMKPFEFEVLVKQLFEAMGMKSWVTQASRDDGLDALAVNEDPIMGGVCVIQAKRYKGTVEPDAVRALAGVMDDKRASRGVLVTTSRFGKASWDFVARHGRIQLIEGPHLKHLLAEYLNLDVLLGPQTR
ncbi:restriction endonuclease [Amycolatopsis methanolica]|uniref:restriction endonuclease n=1 Tax=Amycolatopsis methanolica TaxID=1814 RepID=UPI00343F7AA7